MVVDQDRTPNWGKWRHVPNVELWEAVALSLDIEPNLVKFHYDGWTSNTHFFEESELFNERIFVAERNLSAGGALKPMAVVEHRARCQVSLASFATWACSINWEIPQQLVEMGDEINLPVDTSQANIAELEERVRALVEQNEELKSTTWDGFDVAADSYPEELDIALQAWRAVSNQKKAGSTPKQQLAAWVEARYPTLSTDARKRIATLCNWDTRGGRRKNAD